MPNNKRIGELGESIASCYLIKKGWEIIKRNYRRKSDEIDIIARSIDGTVVFCEVKAFATDGLIDMNAGNIDRLMPEDNLTALKFRRISRTCGFFARQHPGLIDEEKGWRIDLIAIDIRIDGAVLDLRHYENI